jgi:hypothetical protein
MGVRPSLDLVIAITDIEHVGHTITDKRWTLSNEALSTILDEPIPPLPESVDWLVVQSSPIHTFRRDGWEILMVPGDFRLPGIVAVKVLDADCPKDILWALSDVVPGWKDSRFIEISRLPLEDDFDRGARAYEMILRGHGEYLKSKGEEWTRAAEEYRQLRENGHNYSLWPDQFLVWLEFAKYILEDVCKMRGLQDRDYRLGLYWNWS